MYKDDIAKDNLHTTKLVLEDEIETVLNCMDDIKYDKFDNVEYIEDQTKLLVSLVRVYKYIKDLYNDFE